MKTFLLLLLLLPPLFPESEVGLPEVLSGRSPLIQRLPTTQWASQAFVLSWLTLKQQRQTSQFSLSLVLSLSCLLPSAGQIKLKSSHRRFPSCQRRLQLFLSTASWGLVSRQTNLASLQALVQSESTQAKTAGAWFPRRNMDVDFHFTLPVNSGAPSNHYP